MAPSKVLHLRNLPDGVTEKEVVLLGVPFGTVANVLLLKQKNQAFLEMGDASAASALVGYYVTVPATVRCVSCMQVCCLQWSLLASRGLCWPRGVSAGLQWSLLASGGLCWPPGVSAGLPGSLLVSGSLCWPPVVSAGLRGSLLASGGLLWSPVVSAGLPGSLLASEGLCWPPGVSAGLQWSQGVSAGLQWSLLASRVSADLQWSLLASGGLLWFTVVSLEPHFVVHVDSTQNVIMAVTWKLTVSVVRVCYSFAATSAKFVVNQFA